MPFPLPKLPLLLIFASLPVLFAGCSDGNAEQLRVRVVRGGDQCAAAGKRFAEPLILEVRAPGPVQLHLEPAPGSDLVVTPARAISAGSGTLSFQVTAGKKLGDQFLHVIPGNKRSEALRVRFVSGVEVEGDGGEALTGKVVGTPVRVRLRNADGTPIAGAPVGFSFLATAEGADTTALVQTPRSVTDRDGWASTSVRLGKITGVYRLGIDIDNRRPPLSMRSKAVALYGVNPWRVGVTVLAGLAIFIFGMNLMSEGLRIIAGDNMRKVLQFFTSNRLVALIAGAAVTAVLQSSSATSVMVVGFINAGLLTLKQGLGIIFGASIGSTVTAQIISFNLSALALPAVIAGVALMFSSRQTVRGWARAVLGFGLLFYGLTMMSGELRILGEMPTFQRVFRWFNCAPAVPGGVIPFGSLLGALVIGIVFTIIIQSSGAFTGIVLALASGGLVNFPTAFVMLLGANVGTTVTAIFAAIPGNRVAKQAAIAHTLFKSFSAVVMAALLYVPWGPDRTPVFLALADAVTPGNPFGAVPQNLERHIAMAYTMVNVVSALGLLPFLGVFVRFCNWLLPIRDAGEVKPRVLEPVLLATPSIALKQTTAAIRLMVVDAWKMVSAAVNTHFIEGDDSKKKIAALESEEERIDGMQEEITDYLVKLTRRPLTAPQSQLIPLLMHCTNDAERIADHCETILALSERIREEKNPLSATALKELARLWEVLDDQAENVISGLENGEEKPLRNAVKDEHKVEKLADKFEEEHIERLRKGRCSAATGVIYIEMLGELAKISARLANISDRTPEIQKHYVRL